MEKNFRAPFGARPEARMAAARKEKRSSEDLLGSKERGDTPVIDTHQAEVPDHTKKFRANFKASLMEEKKAQIFQKWRDSRAGHPKGSLGPGFFPQNQSERENAEARAVELRVKEAEFTLKRFGFTDEGATLDLAQGTLEFPDSINISRKSEEDLRGLGVLIQKENGKLILDFDPQKQGLVGASPRLVELVYALVDPDRIKQTGAEIPPPQSLDKEVSKMTGVTLVENERINSPVRESVPLPQAPAQATMESPGTKPEEIQSGKFYMEFAADPESLIRNLPESKGVASDTSYIPVMSLRAVTEMLSTIYQKPEAVGERLLEIMTTFERIKTQARKATPGKDESGYEAFALKRLVRELRDEETSTLSRITREKVDLRKDGSSMQFPPEFVLGDFIQQMKQMEALSKKS